MKQSFRFASIAALLFASPVAAQQTGSYEELQRFSAVLAHIRSNYADSVTYRSLVRSAIDGMLRSLDPHSWFASPEDAARLNALERGELATIGVSVELADGAPTILDVTDGAPADRAGVRPGDRLVRIDRQPLAGLDARGIALKLAGEKGSKVALQLERGARLDPDTLSLVLKREMPRPARSVVLVRMVGPTTGYLRLGEFGEKSADEVRKAIDKLRDQKATQLILDLRGNPGGIVTEAVAMAERFLPANTLVFTTRGRQRSANVAYRTKGNGEFRELPLVVLIDQGSASASEALAASLQDHDRAVIAGRRSFGKALMQTGFFVPDGFVQLTVGHVVSPSGRYIQRPYTGLQLQQYYAFAGDSAWQDTTRRFKTDIGRKVLGGGGVAPDVVLPTPPVSPRWFTVAADSGWDRIVADSVAFTLGTDAAARTAWLNDHASWDRLLPPLLARVRGRLQVPADPDPTTRSFIVRRLAVRVATVRWGDEAGDELKLASDPDILAAVPLFARRVEILKQP